MEYSEVVKQVRAAKAAGMAMFVIQLSMKNSGIPADIANKAFDEVFGAPKNKTVREQTVEFATRAALRSFCAGQISGN